MAPKIADDEEPGMWGDPFFWAPKLLDFKVKQKANSLSAFFVGWFLRRSFFPGHGWILRLFCANWESHCLSLKCLHWGSKSSKTMADSQSNHTLPPSTEIWPANVSGALSRWFLSKKTSPFFLANFGLLQISPSWQDFKVRNQHRNKSGSRCEPLTEKD